ncbi:dipeptidase [Microbispora sp. SCL1-1]|uniref:dipeptidase n=1 Tax=unclassified Microbispora TaxID=2614687 RepID=UPI00115A42C3|nr:MULTISPECIES: dipeptidase [unclassified Microbispora]NJP25300.1 dipeptidase [Microbispora sp. CL1-1]TQS13748.1 dipeptidase [Microbispora sp. SCL1-1]
MLSFDSTDFDSTAAYLDELAAYVAVPSVSRDASAETMRTAAEWLAAQLSFAGGRVVATEGHPIVRGEWLGAPGAPTILVYGHYDVQPTGDPAEWRTPPFELRVDGDVIRGRGVTDDKGPVFIVLKVAQAFIEQEGALPLNVKFLFEGEEEIGSPHLPAYLREHADELAADLVISADGAMWRPGEPSLSIASKGLVTLTVEVGGAGTDLHSGRYGGTVANPVHALSEILAGLHTADGRVAVDGFYDGIPELSDERRAAIAAVPFDDDRYREDLGLDALFGEAGYSTLERLWERPTLEINGVLAGGKYTVIPHVATAHISCRLVPGQRPERVLQAITDHVLAQKIPGVRVAVRPDEGGVPAYTIPADHPAIRAATEALAHVYPGQDVLLAVIAGTLPATALFEEVLGAKTLFFSFSTADENLHAPNEFMRISRLREGMRAWERLWRLLADGPHRLAPVHRDGTR